MLFSFAIKKRIDRSIRKIIAKATARISRSAAKRKYTEPQYVEPLITMLPRALSAIFRTSLFRRKDRFYFRGVFVHQSPEVEYQYENKCSKRKYCCEAGDMLILLSDESVFGKVKYRALLLQAKKIQPDVVEYPKRIKKKDKAYAQYRLYLKWPKFSFTCRQNGSTQSVLKDYDFSPKAPNKGAQYLFLKEKPGSVVASGAVAVSESVPKMQISAKPFASVICDLIDGVDGCEVQPRCTAQPNSWSSFVWDLVSHVYLGKISKCYKKGSRRVSHYDIERRFLQFMPGSLEGKQFLVCNVLGCSNKDHEIDVGSYCDFDSEVENGIGIMLISRVSKEKELVSGRTDNRWDE